MRTPNIIEFTTDPQLLGLSLSDAQETLLRAIYGLPLTTEQLELWRACTGREDYPAEPFSEVTVVAGARAGKDSRIAAPIVCYEAVFGGHDKHLSKGERGMIPLVAQDRRAAGIAFGYIRSYLEQSPLLSGEVADMLSTEAVLRNGISISCFPCTLASLRGWSIPVGVLDELGFFRLEGQHNSDAEVQASIRRGQLSFPAPKLLKISTPYLKGGVLFDDFSRHFGQDSPDLLVWKASSALMNPSITAASLDRERRRDPQRYAREYEAEFSDDLTAFLPWEWIESVVVEGRHELGRQDGVQYFAAVDPSGGGADAFTCSIVHVEGDELRVVQDVLRGWSRRGGESPDLRAVVTEIAELTQSYGIVSVVGDRYAAGWVRQAFEADGIQYIESWLTRSQAYLEALPLFSQGRLALLDHRQLTRELQCLERKKRSGGKDAVDHPSRGHDDYANVTTLAACVALESLTVAAVSFTIIDPEEHRMGFFYLGEE